MKRGRHKIRLGLLWNQAVLALLVFSLLLSSCEVAEPPSPAPPWYDLDPVFRKFYEFMGGQEMLGDVISYVNIEENRTVQWVQAGKLVHDPYAGSDFLFHLEPLGKQLGVSEPPLPPPLQETKYYVDGHYVYPDFWPLYEKYGMDYFGRPLSEVHYNPISFRYEQYFERVGLYRLEGSPGVHMLHYGVWACGDLCTKQDPNKNSTPGDVKIYGYIDPTFQPMVDALGLDFTGFSLSEPYLDSEGKWVQVFSNLVMVADLVNDPTSVRFRPMTKAISILSDNPNYHSGDPNMIFYPVNGDLGYDIPVYFWNYMMVHGGFDVFGLPITHLEQLEAGSTRQCYANLCLAYSPAEIDSRMVKPEPLGYKYRGLFHPVPIAQNFATPTPSVEVTTISVWESFPYLEPGQMQTLSAAVMDNFTPIPNMRTELIILMPDGHIRSYMMPPTDAQGQTALLLPAFQAANGTLISYQICAPRNAGDKLCTGDSFIIWDNR